MRLNAIDIDKEGISNHKRVRLQENRGEEFSRLLADHTGDLNKRAVTVVDKPVTGPKMTFLGTISQENPTVSDLLIKNPTYRKHTWSIVHSGQNQDKPFTRMQAGTKVYINRDTQEILWDQKDKNSETISYFVNERSISPSPDEKAEPDAPKPDPVMLGTISRKNPTVSNLLFQNPAYRKRTWEIVHAEGNRSKPFTRMRPGTKVYLDPESLEVSWDRKPGQSKPRIVKSTLSTPPPALAAAVQEDPFSEGLADAVEPYLGKPYEELDCYQLVVQGLEKLGVKYEGRGGLAEQLIKTAVSRGLPRNAYLNGEGLIRNSGSLLFSKSFSKIGRPEDQAQEVFGQIKPLLRKGFILSFSTPTRGHTGIISKRDGSWTYINSGNMDHQVESRSAAKGVGEEFLGKEIDNWFKLAFERHESLQITLGRLNEEKLRSAML